MEGPWEPLGGPWRSLGGSLGDQTGSSIEGPWGSLGGPWGSLGGSLGDQTGTQDWSGTGLAPGTQKCRKCVTVTKKTPGDKRPGSGHYSILGPPRGLSKIAN